MAFCRSRLLVTRNLDEGSKGPREKTCEGIDATRMNYYALSVNKISVGVLGASGYAGRELCALISRHPSLSLAFATANDQRGATVRLGGCEVTFVASDDADL